MKGHVFQTYAEQAKKGQFTTTMDELKVYIAENFSQDAKCFKSLFWDLIKPNIPKTVREAIPSDKLKLEVVESPTSDGRTKTEERLVVTRDSSEREVDEMIFRR